jgi:hypothetical protein
LTFFKFPAPVPLLLYSSTISGARGALAPFEAAGFEAAWAEIEAGIEAEAAIGEAAAATAEFAVGGTAAEASEASEAVEAAAVTAGVTNGLSDRIGSERIESAGLDS